MLIKTTDAGGREIRGWIKRLDANEKKIYLDKQLSFLDERKGDEKIAVDFEDEDGDEIVVSWRNTAYKYEMLLPYPFDVETEYKWNAKPKNARNIRFCGEKAGFKQGCNPGPYEKAWLKKTESAKKKMCEYDMIFPKMLLPYQDILDLFSDATDEKGNNRYEGNEHRVTRNPQGEKVESPGIWSKYHRHYNPFNVDFF